MSDVVAQMRRTLLENTDEKTIASGRRVFKEEIKFYGVTIPRVNRISKEYFDRIKDLPKEQIFSLCDELWASGYNEEQWAACNWSYWIKERYLPGDMDTFERWLERYVSNWASCDTLCNHTIGTIVEMYPALAERLPVWARSGNRWVRRGAAVTLIIPARKGLFHDEVFRIADILLTDPDDLVQKGYGWMLKAAADSDRERVFNYVIANKQSMPRTALRYAIEKMPSEMRKEAMAK